MMNRRNQRTSVHLAIHQAIHPISMISRTPGDQVVSKQEKRKEERKEEATKVKTQKKKDAQYETNDL